jgi:hypothetical protein
MPTLVLDALTPGSVLVNPESKMISWRVEEVDKAHKRIRLVRSKKTGELHGLVKDTAGNWVNLGEINRYAVIGHYGDTTPETAAPKAGKKTAAVKTTMAPADITGVISLTDPDRVLASIALFRNLLSNTAEAFDRTLQQASR